MFKVDLLLAVLMCVCVCGLPSAFLIVYFALARFLHFLSVMLSVIILCDSYATGGSGIRGLIKGNGDLPEGTTRSLLWSKTKMEDPQEDFLVVHCLCIYMEAVWWFVKFYMYSV